MADSSDDDVRQLTREEKEYAAVHLNETDNNRQNAVAEIRRWILDSDDLCARTDDFFILRFLRACKFNIEKAKCKMRNYHQLRTNMPEWYANKDPFLPELQELYGLGVFLPLLKVDDHGRVVIFVRATVHDPYKHKILDVLKASVMIVDLILRNHVPASLYGVKVIIDLANVTFGHALQLRPNVIRTLVHSWQNCYPVRIRSINYINAPGFVNVTLRIFKQFMNTKLKQRLHIYSQGTRNGCCEEMPVDILPVEYGGTGGTMQELKDYWKQMVEQKRDWFADDEKYKVIPK